MSGSGEFPAGLVEWCVRELGAEPIARLFATAQISELTAVRLEDGREVVVKSRPDEAGRAATCVRVQRAPAEGRLSVPAALEGGDLGGWAGRRTPARSRRPNAV